MNVRATAAAAALLILAACAHAPPRPVPPPLPDQVEAPDIPPIDLASEAPYLPALPRTIPGLPSGIDPKDFDLAIHYNERVQYFLDFFGVRYHDRFASWLERQGRYDAMISRKLEEAGLPGDLLYLSLIESGFSPVAYSRAHAVGLWQFIASTARMEGLEVSDFIDERRDPEKATDAAIRHLRRLYDRYGSWYLAAAAYNSGAGRVDRVLAEQVDGARGNDSIFWTIQSALPAETRDYVPMLIAATLLGRKRDVFGFSDVVPQDPDAVDVVRIPDATELGVIARAADVPVETIKALNPQLFREMTPPGRATDVRVPAGYGQPFQTAFAKIPPAERVSFVEHLVKRGETLSGIAARYGASVSDIQRLNGISRPDRISVGKKLRVPLSAAARAQASAVGKVAMDTPAGPRTIVHLVRPGDTIWGIARKYHVTPSELLAWNSLSEDSMIRPGDKIQVRQ